MAVFDRFFDAPKIPVEGAQSKAASHFQEDFMANLWGRYGASLALDITLEVTNVIRVPLPERHKCVLQLSFLPPLSP
jgi:hypothetical protein